MPGDILIVEDDKNAREGLQKFLESEKHRVIAFDNGKEALRYLEKNKVDLILTDLKMPGLDGIKMLKRSQEISSSFLVIILTAYGTVEKAVEAMKLGAYDFLTKPFEDKELIGAVQEALQKASETRAILDERKDIERRLETLTPREREVLTYVITGMLNKQIAYELGMSEKTVKVHRARVMKKMSADSLASLVRMAQELGIFSPDEEL